MENVVNKTILDSPEKVRAYVVRNKLDVVWAGWSSPRVFTIDSKGFTKGIRINGYTPFYDSKIIEDYGKKICERMSAKDRTTGKIIRFEKMCDGHYILPPGDFERGILERFICSKCGGASPTIFRIVNKYNRNRLWFDTCAKVVEYTSKEVRGNKDLRGSGRTFYSTQSIHDNRILKSGVNFGWDNLKAVTLYVDIDLKEKHLGKHIVDLIQREKLQKAMLITEDVLSTFVPNSWNVQSSGDGIYYMIHHLLSQKGGSNSNEIGELIRGFNRVCQYIDDLIKNNGITGVGVDPINRPGQLWKLVGSPHQRFDLAAIPMDWSSASKDIVKMNGSDFELKNFDINKYVDFSTGKWKIPFYDRYDLSEASGLYKYVKDIREAASKKGDDLVKDKKVAARYDPDGRILQKTMVDLKDISGWTNLTMNLEGNDILIDYKKLYDNKLKIRSKDILGIDQLKQIIKETK